MNKINSYDTLTVGKYLKIRELLKEELEDVELQTNIIAEIKGIKPEEVLDMSISEYSKCAADINFLTVKPIIKSKCPSKIKLGDNEYYVMKNSEKLNAAQFIDYSTYMKQPDPDGLIANILSIFIIPIGKKYNTDYDIADVQEDIKEHLSIQTAMDICFFFRKKQARYINYTLIYLELMLKLTKAPEKQKEMILKARKMIKELEDLQRDLVG